MARKEDLQDWVIESLNLFGGKASIITICKKIWEKHEAELKKSGDLFYTWQYDVRWAAQTLRDKGILKAAKSSPKGIWILR